MGSTFEFGVVSTSETEANQFIDLGIAEIKRLEDLLTEFDESSVTCQLNREASTSEVKVPEEVFQLLERSLQLSKLTRGYFDITVGPIKKLYQFKNKTFALPKKIEIKTQLKKVGHQYISLRSDTRTVRFRRNQMQLSFAAIGKGYAADAVKKTWQELGLQSGYINASGDLTAFGCNHLEEPWRIAISDPDIPTNGILHIPLDNASIATSGDYEQHLMHEGKRYSHNLNPKTGLPIEGIKSVSVCSPSAELSDALATAVHAMGVENGLSLINQLPKTHVVIIDATNQIHFSKNLAYEAVS